VRIQHVRLESASLGKAARFYADLGLSTEVDATSAHVRVGRSVLTLVPGMRTTGAHHIALTVPSAVLPQARARLSTLTSLRARDGVDQFHLDPPFGPADSVYADDPDGTLLELIGRDRPHDHDDVNLARDVLAIGEVAIPVESVPEAVNRLRGERGLDTVIDGAEFAAVGDHDGMIILVAPDRRWFPTDDRYPNLTPLQITIDAVGPPIVFSNGTLLD
jgi:catechol-2,3-dioxygenase